jgi:hypothetical protein
MFCVREYNGKCCLRGFGTVSTILFTGISIFWCEQGFFEALWIAGLQIYNETAGINCADRCMSKSIPGTGGSRKKSNRTGGKNDSKRHMLLVDGAGVSLSLVVSELIGILLDAIIMNAWIFQTSTSVS